MFKLTAIASMIAALFATPALAANTGEHPSQTNSDGIQNTTATLPTIVVTAPTDPNALPPPYAGGQVATGGHLGFLGNKSVMDTPFNTVNYTSQLIQDQQAESLTDVLANNNPSFRIDFPSNGLATSFTVRGNTAGDVAYDGLYLGISPGIESLERLEVLVGANVLLNGLPPGGSIGAYINQVPKKATEKPVTDLTLGYYGGQFGTSVDVGRRYGPDEQFGIRFNGAYRDGNTEVYNQGHKSISGVLSMDWHNLDDSVRLSTNFGYRENDTYSPTRTMFLYPNSSFKIPSPPSKNWQNSWLYEKNRQQFATARAEVDITPNVTAYAAVGGSENHDEELYTNSYIMDSKGNLLQQHVYWPLYHTYLTAETGLRGKLQTGAVKHNWSVALSGLRHNYGITQTTLRLPFNASNLYSPVFIAKPSIAGLPDSYHQPLTTKAKLYGLALADTMSVLNDKVQLTLGLRDQGIDTTNYLPTGAQSSHYKKTVLTPAVGVVVRPVRNLSLYANYIEGLQQGQVVPAGYSNAGQSLAPFVSKQYEIGAKYDFGKWMATLSAYQISTPNAVANGNAYTADGEQRIKGLELNVYGEVAPGVRLLGGAALTDAIQTHTTGGAYDGNRVTGVPNTQFNLGAEWDFLPGWTASTRAIYTGSEYIDSANRQSIPSVITFDAGLRYTTKLYRHKTDFRFSVENLANKSYWIGGQGYVMQADPRTFLASVTVHL